MNPYLQVILWAVGIVVLFIILMAWNNHKWKKAQKNRIKRIFGKMDSIKNRNCSKWNCQKELEWKS